MKKIFLGLTIVLVSINIAYSQRNFAQEADIKFRYDQYYDATKLYQRAYSKVKGNRVERARILFQIGLCYRMTNDTRRAETTFKRVTRANYPDPKAKLYLADALKANEKYEEAIIEYQEYSKLVPDDPIGKIGAESCSLAVQWIENPTRYEVDNFRRGNSKTNDFAPTYADRNYRSLIFTTARDEVGGRGYDAWTGERFTDLFVINMDRKGNWGSPVSIDETEEVNTNSNEGAVSLNEKANTLYFTRCQIEKTSRQGCKIFTATKKGKGWGNVEEIPLIADTLTAGHPAISSDELTMYFSSNMPGGQGERDIWMVQRPKKNKPFEKPVNLGSKINTPGNEVFPTLKNDTTLFFSSDYHPGIGGIDIFKTEFVNGEWTEPENLKCPINSAGDDFHIVFNQDRKMLDEMNVQETGFFSSNRKGGRGGDDIWSFTLPPIMYTLSGTVYDDSTRLKITNALIVLEGSDGTLIQQHTNKDGLYKFDRYQIRPNTSYNLAVSKDNYYKERGRETTVGLTKSTDLVRDFYLVPIPKKPIVLPDILYDLAKWDLKPQFQDSLEGLVKTMVENPNIIIELQSHTDIRPIPMTNDTLSQKRAESVVIYLISKGISPNRLVAKGYGERVPRVLERDMVSTYGGQSFAFKKGTILTKSYIESLPTHAQREAAHYLNRRTTFQVIATNYVPTGDERDLDITPFIIDIVGDDD